MHTLSPEDARFPHPRKVLRGHIKIVIYNHKRKHAVRFDVESDKAQYLPIALRFAAHAIIDEAGVQKLVGDLTVEQVEALPVAATFFSVLGMIDHFACRTDLFGVDARVYFIRHVNTNAPTIDKA